MPRVPAVEIVPDRPVYRYGDFFFLYWGSRWYWSQKAQGPWHQLDQILYPPRKLR